MIVQAIGLLDDLDKELNTYAMRVREWYGWHFPEMTKIVADNIKYAKAVRAKTLSSMHYWVVNTQRRLRKSTSFANASVCSVAECVDCTEPLHVHTQKKCHSLYIFRRKA